MKKSRYRNVTVRLPFICDGVVTFHVVYGCDTIESSDSEHHLVKDLKGDMMNALDQ